jgi:uncharacterized protein (UPF0276 family)
MAMSEALPAGVGLGLRGPHVPRILADAPAVPFFELLTDNHLAAGGALRYQAEAIAAAYPVTLHGVGMSLGSIDPLDRGYVGRVRALARATGAVHVSEHLSFIGCDGYYANDLLPLPWTEEALEHVAGRIRQAQDLLGRRLLIENITAYVRYADAALSELGFLSELCHRTGCGLLIDINNAYVNAANHGEDAAAWMDAVPWALVGELHVAGHRLSDDLLIDTHDGPVSAAVLALLAGVAPLAGHLPVLLEWDHRLPAWETLAAEAARVEERWQCAGGSLAA